MQLEGKERPRALNWRRSSHGEWVCEGVGVVVSIFGKLWYAYSSEGARLGPFVSQVRATEALEARGG
jgi:hypothetical protein